MCVVIVCTDICAFIYTCCRKHAIHTHTHTQQYFVTRARASRTSFVVHVCAPNGRYSSGGGDDGGMGGDQDDERVTPSPFFVLHLPPCNSATSHSNSAAGRRAFCGGCYFFRHHHSPDCKAWQPDMQSDNYGHLFIIQR